jgi:hypothetical protein
MFDINNADIFFDTYEVGYSHIFWNTVTLFLESFSETSFEDSPF